MALASNNDFPSILVTEQSSAPTAPAAGKQRLYMKTDHKFYHRDSSGTETEMGGSDSNAVHTNVAAEIHGVTEKATLASTDVLLLEDSADSWNKKRAPVSALSSGSGGGMSQDFSIWDSFAPPLTSGSNNDEFADASGGVPLGWTECDFASVITPVETERGLEMSITTRAGCHGGIYQAIPSGDGTWETSLDLLGTMANYFGGGIVLWEDATNSSGDLACFRLELYTSGVEFNVQRWSDYQTYSSNYAATVTALGVGAPNGRLRVRRTGTTYSFDVGVGSSGWLMVFSGALGFTPTHIGPSIFIDNAGVTSKTIHRFWRYSGSDIGLTSYLGGDRVGGHRN